MEKLLVLGTGNAGATRCYNTCFILHDGKEPLLVDAGGGNAIITQLERAGIRPADIHHAFLTHCHTDHLFGMIWMIRSVAQNIRGGSYEGTFTLYCHDELAGVVHSVADMTLPASMTQYIGDRIHIVPVEDGEERPFGSYQATFFDIGSTKAKTVWSPRWPFTAAKSSPASATNPVRPEAGNTLRAAAGSLNPGFLPLCGPRPLQALREAPPAVREAANGGMEPGVENLVLWHTEDTRLAERKTLYTAEGHQCFPAPVCPGRSGIHRLYFQLQWCYSTAIYPQNLRTGIR